MICEVTVWNEKRAEGNHSIYVRGAASNGLWYTGLTFASVAKCNAVVVAIRKAYGL